MTVCLLNFFFPKQRLCDDSRKQLYHCMGPSGLFEGAEKLLITGVRNGLKSVFAFMFKG